MPFKTLCSFFSSDLAVDLGTYHVVVYARGRAIVCKEPAVVAVDKNREVIAIGSDVDRTLANYKEEVMVVRPLKYGAIADLDLAEKLIQYCIRKAHNGKEWVRPRVVVGVNPGMTQVERHAIESCTFRAGAAEVYLVESAIAAGHGAGMPMDEVYGIGIIDIGGGTTDINIISRGNLVYSRSVRAAGLEMDHDIIQYIKRKYDLLIGQRAAETIKIQIGSVYPFDEPKTTKVRGRHLLRGELNSIDIDAEEVRDALADSMSLIVDAIRVATEKAPPALIADLIESGFVLVGAGALLGNLDKRLMVETGFPVTLADDPPFATILGLGKTLYDFALHKRIKKMRNPVYDSNWEY